MAANTNPIFALTPVLKWGATPLLTAANAAMDGTGTVVTVFTADATNAGRCDEIRFKSAGTNVATVARIFINNGAANATAANNILWDEVSLPATTASATAAIPTFVIAGPKGLPPGYNVNVTIGTAVAAGWYPSASGGQF